MLVFKPVVGSVLISGLTELFLRKSKIAHLQTFADRCLLRLMRGQGTKENHDGQGNSKFLRLKSSYTRKEFNLNSVETEIRVQRLKWFFELVPRAIESKPLICSTFDMCPFEKERTSARFAGMILDDLLKIAQMSGSVYEVYEQCIADPFELFKKSEYKHMLHRSDPTILRHAETSFAIPPPG